MALQFQERIALQMGDLLIKNIGLQLEVEQLQERLKERGSGTEGTEQDPNDEG